MNRTRVLLAERLRGLLRERGLTQMQLAERAKLDQTSVSKVLNGKVNMTIDALQAMLDGLGVSADQLFGQVPANLQPTTIEGFSAVPLRARPLAAGEPIVTEPDERDSVLAFRDDLLQRRAFVRPICFRVGRREESMMPLIQPNDVVLLDQNHERRTSPAPGRIFAVNFGPLTSDPGGAVKRIERDGRWLIVGSENPDKSRYPTRAYDISEKNLLDILKGEVVWFGRYVTA